MNGLTRKVGPLPAWAWAALILVAFFVYNRRKASSSSTPSASSSPTSPDPNAANPVPGFDAANNLGSGASGFGTPPTTTIYNYYGVSAAGAGQAAGGGTAPGPALRPPKGGGYSPTPVPATGIGSPGTQAGGGQRSGPVV